MTRLCSVCGLSLHSSARYCPACQSDAGYPNVYAASTDEEVKALEARLQTAREDAAKKNCLPVLEQFGTEVAGSHAIMCRSLLVVLSLVSSDEALYISFYRQVESGARIPEENIWDRARLSVDATLFPYYYKELIPALLSLDNRGSSYYGPCAIVLKDSMIERRSTVFEENSVVFFKNRYDINKTGLTPSGYRAPWTMRDKLAMAKCHGRINLTTVPSDFPNILVKRGADTQDDDFIEVHIYGSIHRKAIEKVVCPQPRGADRALFGSLKRKLREIGASVETL